MKIEPPYIADKLPDALFRLIGELIFVWARLEYQLGVIARVGYRMSKETGRAMTIGMDLNVICGTLRTLTKDAHWINDKEIREEIGKLSDDISKASKARHSVAHGVFGYYLEKPNEFYRYLMKASEHRVKPSKAAVSADTLSADVADARVLLERAFEITQRLKALKRTRIPASRQRLAP